MTKYIFVPFQDHHIIQKIPEILTISHTQLVSLCGCFEIGAKFTSAPYPIYIICFRKILSKNKMSCPKL